MGTTYNFGASSINIIMKVFICLSAVLALASCEPFLTSGPAAGPVHAAIGGLVATKRGYRPIALEGYSEDDNQDGFVDPIGQVAPVVYAAPHYGYAAPFVMLVSHMPTLVFPLSRPLRLPRSPPLLSTLPGMGIPTSTPPITLLLTPSPTLTPSPLVFLPT